MALVDSLLSAMVRADGDALVMHVGERPYVVTQAGTLDLSTHGLNLGAMTGMLQQLLPAEQQSSLEEFGAVEHKLPSLGDDRFTLVAARGGDDIWIEIRRRRFAAAVAAPVAEPPSAYAQSDSGELRRDPADLSAGLSAEALAKAGASAQAEAASGRDGGAPQMTAAPEPVQEIAAAPQMTGASEPVPVEVIAEPEPIADTIPEPEIEPILEVAAAPDAVAELELVPAVEPIAEPELVPEVEPHVEPVAELDHAALLDQLIPIDDPDVEEMPLELVAAIAEQRAAEQSQPELVGTSGSSDFAHPSGSTGSSGSTDQSEIDAAVEHAELVAPRSAEPVEDLESAYARADSDELRRDSADLSAGLSAEALAKAGALAQAEAASGRVGEPAYARAIEHVEHVEHVEPVEHVEHVEPVEHLEPVARVEPVARLESAYARRDSDELRRDYAVLSAEALAKAGASAEAEAASGREGEPVERVEPAYARTEPVEPVEPAEPAHARAVEPVEPVEPAYARAEAAAPVSADLSAGLSAEALAKAGASAQAEAASGREGEPAYARETGPYVVLPMTRTVRIEVPTRVMSQSRTSTVERLLQIAAARSASSLFLTSDSRPYIRVEGDIRQLEGEAMLSKAEIEAAVMEIVPQEVQDPVGRGEAIEWIAELPELGRIRCTSFRDHRGPGVVFNLIATRAATAEQLGLPREVQALATEAEGLVLVAGPRGSGKSTLMSALVDLVNRQRTDYVIMLERQIRLVHDNRTALVSQREIRGSADEALAAARAALRENPDVLVVDDLSSAHMVPLLLEAAAGGLLVFVSITAPSTADAVARFLELAPPGSRTSVHAAMAETFRGAVSQVLLKKTAGGRVVAREIMLATAAVTRLIGDGHLTQLPLALESGRRHGMVPLTDVLLGLVQSGVVDVREAFRKTHDRDRLLSGLKREGVDTSVVERLA